MIALQLRVIAQGIEVITSSDLVSGSVEIYTAEFEFNDAWTGFTKTALFDYVDGNDPTEVVMPGTSCTIPWEPLEKHGYLRVGVCGVNGTQVMPTVWTELLQIKEGAVAGSIHIEPTETTYEQVMALLAGIDGGTGGQILAKQSDVDYDFKWVDNPAQYVPGTEGDVVVIGSNQNIADSKVSKDNLILAPQLASNNYKTDSVPYIYRQTGGGIGTGNREYDEITGGSIVWNQIQKTRSTSTGSGGLTMSYDTNGELTVVVNNPTSSDYITLQWNTYINGHQYLFYLPNAPRTIGFEYYAMGYHQREFLDNWVLNYTGTTGVLGTRVYVSASTANGTYKLKPMCYDLTEMFGSAIADYLYTQNYNTAGFALAYMQKMGLLTASYYAYTANPVLESVSGLQSHKTVGFNRCNSPLEFGNIDTSGNNSGSDKRYLRTSDYIKVEPNNTLCFYASTSEKLTQIYGICYDENKQFISRNSVVSGSTPAVTKFGTLSINANTHYVRMFAYNNGYFTTTEADFCISLSDPVRNGTYEPYEEHTYPLDDSLTLRGVAILDDNNNIKFDGDAYAPDGTVTRRYGIVDLGTVNWVYDSAASDTRFFTTSLDCNAPTSSSVTVKAVCALYATMPYNQVNGQVSNDMVMGAVKSGNTVYFAIKNLSYTSAAAFKTAMSGVYLIYELATPTTETAEPYDAVQICDPLGTEEYVTTGIVPVGHITQYPENQVAKLDGLPSDFSTLIAPTEVAYKATRNYTVGRLLIVNNILYKATANISSGATLTVGTNITATTLDEVIASL